MIPPGPPTNINIYISQSHIIGHTKSVKQFVLYSLSDLYESCYNGYYFMFSIALQE